MARLDQHAHPIDHDAEIETVEVEGGENEEELN
jgi:hypothetical protein